jgi:dihydrofolate reductase
VARLVYAAITSLDGSVADEQGSFDWSAPDEEVHRFVNELERPIGTHLLGRRMYEVLAFWDTAPGEAEEPGAMGEYADIWRGTDKVVYSTTLAEPAGPRTRIERAFDPEAVRAMKEQATADLSVGGPHLAAQALAAGLVDDLHLFLSPVVVGGGTRALPEGLRMGLELLAERRFGNGVVHLHYRVSSSA